MADIIIAVVLVIVVGGAALYIRKAKKRGVKCIGCPSDGNCTCGCHEHKIED